MAFMKKIIIISALVMGYAVVGMAQQSDLYVQLSGTVKNDLNDPVPYVHVNSLKNNRNAISDQNGRFTIIVEPRDTVTFYCLGFQKEKLVMPASFTARHVLQDVKLKTDTVMLAEVDIFPWKTYGEFKEAVVHMELPDQKEMEYAAKNIALIQTQIRIHTSATPNMNFRQALQNHYERNMMMGQYRSISLLNPIAWAKFIKALKNGDFKRKD